MLPVLPKSQIHHNQLSDIKGNSQSSPRPTQSPTQSIKRRSPSMIFRIEHLLPNATCPPHNSPTTTTTTSTTRTMDHTELSPKKIPNTIRAGVHVTQLTVKDTMSQPLEAQALIHVATETTARAYCTLLEDGTILSMTPEIMRKIKLSEDTHSNNALFEVNKGQMELRVTRDIQRDEEIVAWFGEEVTLLMSIPFLTPLNIQGNNRYTCHLCHLTFETPNPLKIHLALGCGRHNIDILWIRLYYAIKTSYYTQQMLPLSLTLPSTATTSRISPILPTSSATSSSISPSHSPQSQPSVSRFSAFKPICSTASMHNQLQHHHHQIAASVAMANTLSMSSHQTTTAAPLSFLPSMSTASLPHMSLLQRPSTSPLNAAAQIEAIVSNMGASKQGHLCIYCGKVYSRKYGLKIHIRTHTGFKPLKCKFCLRPFGDPSNLNKHVRLHLQTSANNSASDAYQCNLCQKILGRRRDLQRHMETRHGFSSSSSTDTVQKVETTNSD